MLEASHSSVAQKRTLTLAILGPILGPIWSSLRSTLDDTKAPFLLIQNKIGW